MTAKEMNQLAESIGSDKRVEKAIEQIVNVMNETIGNHTEITNQSEVRNILTYANNMIKMHLNYNVVKTILVNCGKKPE